MHRLQTARMQGVLRASTINSNNTRAVAETIEQTLDDTDRDPAEMIVFSAAVLDQHRIGALFPHDLRNRLRGVLTDLGWSGGNSGPLRGARACEKRCGGVSDAVRPLEPRQS